MKNTQARKTESMTLVIPVIKQRAIRLRQRSNVIESGKRYDRRSGKRVSE